MAVILKNNVSGYRKIAFGKTEQENSSRDLYL